MDGADHVQVNAGSGSSAGQTVTMEAFDAADNFLGSDSLTLAAALDTLIITADDIAYVVIDTPAQVLVLDDLAFVEAVGEADIVVDPLALDAELCPDEIMAMTVTICNNGSAPLDWALSELVAAQRRPSERPPVAGSSSALMQRRAWAPAWSPTRPWSTRRSIWCWMTAAPRTTSGSMTPPTATSSCGSIASPPTRLTFPST